MSTGSYDDSFILSSHIKLVNHKVTVLNEKLLNADVVKSMFSTPEGLKFAQFMNKKLDVLFNTPEQITLAKEHLQIVDTFVVSNLGLLQDLDYIVNWIKNATIHLSNAVAKKIVLDVNWGLITTLPICKIFVTLCQIPLSFNHHASRMMNFWSYYRVSSHRGTVPMISSEEAVTAFVNAVSNSPLEYVAELAQPIQEPLRVLLLELTPILNSLFGQYCTFDWGQYCIMDDEFIGEKPGPVPYQHSILRYSSVFVQTAFYFLMVFTSYVITNPQFAGLTSGILSEVDTVLLLGGVSMSFNNLNSLSKKHSYSYAIMATIEKDLENKKKIGHSIRIKHLRHLLQGFIDHYAYCEATLWMYAEEILALVGFSFYEICVCMGIEECRASVIELLSTVCEFLSLFAKRSRFIQRNYLFNLATQDYQYLDELMRIYGRVSDNDLAPAISSISLILEAIQSVDLDQFDSGVSYDFSGLYLTHGRIIHEIFSKIKPSDSTLMLSPLLLQIMTVRRHAELCECPEKIFLASCPIDELVRFNSIFTAQFKTVNLPIAACRTFVECFRYFPVNTQTDEVFTKCYNEFLNRLLNALIEPTSIASKNTQIGRQKAYDDGFKTIGFLPIVDNNNHKTYKIESNQVSKISDAMAFMSQIPEHYYHGSKSKDFKNEFRTKFIEMVRKKINDEEQNPLIVSSTLTVMSQILPITFDCLNQDIIPFLLDVIRSNTSKFNRMDINTKAEILSTGSQSFQSEGFVGSYMDLLDKFMSEDYLRSTYEPFGMRFVGDASRKHPFELIFSQQPIQDLVSIFGPDTAVAMESVILKYASDAFSNIIRVFQANRAKIEPWCNQFKQKHKLSKEYNTFPDIQAAANGLLTLGVSTSLINMIKGSLSSITKELFPGLSDVFNSALARMGKKLGKKDGMITEILGIKGPSYFLKERAKGLVKEQLPSELFFFYLALLFGFKDWEEVNFNSESDTFSNNLQVLPIAIGLFLELKYDIFIEKDRSALDYAIEQFFNVLSYIACLRKKKSNRSYQSFLVLVDHFPFYIKDLEYGRIEHSIPFTLIRACYNDIAIADNSNK